jgi:hypothetical protein
MAYAITDILLSTTGLFLLIRARGGLSRSSTKLYARAFDRAAQSTFTQEGSPPEMARCPFFYVKRSCIMAINKA